MVGYENKNNMSQTEIIEFLEKRQGYFTSQQIADKIGLSLSSIVKSLRVLRSTTFIKHKIEVYNGNHNQKAERFIYAKNVCLKKRME